VQSNIRFINELIRIVNGALHLDTEKVRNYTAFLAEKLDAEGEHSTAERLRKLLHGSDHQLRPAGAAFARVLPVDPESRFPLIEQVNTRTAEPGVLLPQRQWDLVREFLSVAKSHAQSDAPGGASLSLLLYGPPGTGKSRLARHIASELKLDLYLARLDGLISSFLGSTAKNIRALFEFASSRPCVLFLDEFDAIAKLRGDTQELGELKRVVNSFIQNLDALGPETIVLAATNHQDLLDSAIWRRFSYRVEFDFPTPELRSELWGQFVPKPGFSARELKLLVDLTDGFSGSDIREACLRLERRHQATGRASGPEQAFEILLNLAGGEGEARRFLSSIRKLPSSHLAAAALRRRNPKLYSHAAVAALLGVSKPTIFRWWKQENDHA